MQTKKRKPLPTVKNDVIIRAIIEAEARLKDLNPLTWNNYQSLSNVSDCLGVLTDFGETMFLLGVMRGRQR